MPVLLYGAAHSSARSLADVRRACGYFKGSREGVCQCLLHYALMQAILHTVCIPTPHNMKRLAFKTDSSVCFVRSHYKYVL